MEAALKEYEEDLKITRRLTELDPNNTGWQFDLGVTHGRVGDVLQEQGKARIRRMMRYGKSLFAIAHRLDRSVDSSNAGWQRELEILHDKVGTLLQAQGNLDAALAAYEKRLVVARRLADQDQSDSGRLSNLSVAHNKIGALLHAQGKFDASLQEYQEDLTISRRLTARDPQNGGFAIRFLAVTLIGVGEVQQARGDLDAAIGAYEEYVAIIGRLVEHNPGNTGLQLDLGVILTRVGDLQQTRGNLEAALSAYDTEPRNHSPTYRDGCQEH